MISNLLLVSIISFLYNVRSLQPIILLCFCSYLILCFIKYNNVLLFCYVSVHSYTLILFCNGVLSVSINYNFVVCSIILYCLITL